MIIIPTLSVPRKHVAFDYPQYSINKQNEAHPESKQIETINSGIARFGRDWNYTTLMIVILKNEILLLSLPLTTGTQIIAKTPD